MSTKQKTTSLEANNHENILVQLKKVQEESGYISQEAAAGIAESLNVSLSEVFGVATFYSFLSVRPKGRNIIRVCQSLPCYLKSSLMVISRIEKELGIKPGGTTADGKFSFELTNCIGACDNPPSMLVNDDVHQDLTPEKISQILKTYK